MIYWIFIDLPNFEKRLFHRKYFDKLLDRFKLLEESEEFGVRFFSHCQSLIEPSGIKFTGFIHFSGVDDSELWQLNFLESLCLPEHAQVTTFERCDLDIDIPVIASAIEDLTVFYPI